MLSDDSANFPIFCPRGLRRDDLGTQRSSADIPVRLNRENHRRLCSVRGIVTENFYEHLILWDVVFSILKQKNAKMLFI
jgi:hypothetical protein